MGLGVRAQCWPGPCLTAGLAMLPVPSPWGLFLGQAGAIFGTGLGLWGWFQMFQCEQEKMGTDGWRVPISGSCWEQVIFRALLTLWGLWSHPERDSPLWLRRGQVFSLTSASKTARPCCSSFSDPPLLKEVHDRK